MSKQDILIKMLSRSDSLTITEMVTNTGLKKSSIINYVKYYLKKLGYTVIIEDKLGQVFYRITKNE